MESANLGNAYQDDVYYYSKPGSAEVDGSQQRQSVNFKAGKSTLHLWCCKNG